MPGMPRENAYEGLPNDQGDIVIHVGEITGIVRRNGRRTDAKEPIP